MKDFLTKYVERPYVKERSYITGMVLILAIAYTLGAAKYWMPHVMCAIAIVLLIGRIFHYFVIGEECYLYDWCYYATVIDLVYIMVFPKSYTLYLVFMGFSNGLQVCSVILMKNALVPHRLDKITSLFLHNIYSFMALIIRNDTSGRYIKVELTKQVYIDYLLYTFIAYAGWFIMYLLVQNVIFASYIQKHKLTSLIDYVKSLNAPVGQFLDKFNGIWKNMIFLGGHFTMFVPTTLLSVAALRYLNVHLLVCLISLVKVLYEGGVYYTKAMKDTSVEEKKDK